MVAGARAELRDCRVEARVDGLWVEGPDTRVEAEWCTLSGGAAAVASATDVAAANIVLVKCVAGSTRTCVRADGPQAGNTQPSLVPGQVEKRGFLRGSSKKLARWVGW